MKKLAKCAQLFFLALCLHSHAAIKDGAINQLITAPGGKIAYYILTTKNFDVYDEPIMEITSRDINGSEKTLLKSRYSKNPKENLTGFYNLNLSPDARTLYFNSQAWAVSGAVHSLNIKTGAVNYIAAGELACIVPNGEHQGDLIVQMHKYYVQGGSHDDLYLVKPNGNVIGLVAQGTDKTGVCPPQTGL
ncbi:hypothetical protein [Atlantibacter hermannii]|uniref:hypothetical protein n=1 Tax=Atlantibacter hermannii TaxID=565 RepID=UPI00254E9F99|nr:hypothetical protein [Atlantibacter hermannii]